MHFEVADSSPAGLEAVELLPFTASELPRERTTTNRGIRRRLGTGGVGTRLGEGREMGQQQELLWRQHSWTELRELFQGGSEILLHLHQP